MTYKTNNRIPTKYFVTQGSGDSDYAIHAGSYHMALSKMGIEDCNIMHYSSILPAEAQETARPEKFVLGSVMDVISARIDGKKGERITAGIIVGDLVKRTNGARFGSLVCELSGNDSHSEMDQRLRTVLEELYKNREPDDLVLASPRLYIESSEVTQEYGTAMVAICFFEYKNELISAYEGYPSFMDSRSPRDKAKYVVFPVPHDKTSSYGKGADKGPSAILHASHYVEDYSIETDSQAVKAGIYTKPRLVTDADGEDLASAIKDGVLDIIKAKQFPILLGGDHGVTIGSIQAMHQTYGKDFCVLQLDAHADLRPSYNGSEYNHACVMNQALKCTDNIVQVGIRSMSNIEKKTINFEKTFFDTDLDPQGFWIDDVIAELSDKVYITLDVDVFNPAIISTGTPEPGGLDYNTVMRLLKKVTQKKKIIGFDLVELAPRPGTTAPEFMCAKLIYELISYINHFGS